MGYFVGIDLGTTFSAAAINRNGTRRDGLARPAFVGHPVGGVRPGHRRDAHGRAGGASGCQRSHSCLAREFKRRMGDTAPIMLGSSPYSAERITGAVLRFVLDAVASRKAARRRRRRHLPRELGPVQDRHAPRARRSSPMFRDAVLITEPFAAAVQYASTERVDDGRRDRGLRPRRRHLRRRGAAQDGHGLRAARPSGRHRAPGWRRLRRSGVPATSATPSDLRSTRSTRTTRTSVPPSRASRSDCIAAKEALSTDSEATIPVMLPGLQSEIRLTRGEFEAMIRPTLRETVDALRRGLVSRGGRGDRPHARSCSWVARRASRWWRRWCRRSSAGRVAIDAHPKHAVALGAAQVMGAARRSAPTSTPRPPRPPRAPRPRPRRPAAATPTAPAAAASGAAAPAAAANAAGSATTAGDAATTASAPPSRAAGRVRAAGARAERHQAPTGAKPARRRRATRRARSPVPSWCWWRPASPSPSPAVGGGDSACCGRRRPRQPAAPAATKCTIASGRCAFLTGVTLERHGDLRRDLLRGGLQPIIYTQGVKGKPSDHHVHFFFDTVGVDHAGSNGTPHRASGHLGQGLRPRQATFNGSTLQNQNSNGGYGAKQMCILVADANHGVEKGSGNCRRSQDRVSASARGPWTGRSRSCEPQPRRAIPQALVVRGDLGMGKTKLRRRRPRRGHCRQVTSRSSRRAA